MVTDAAGEERRACSRDLADHDPAKWVYKEHARAKHAIQRTYLGAWLAILGSRFPLLKLFDGFAGRGRYEGGEEGSPLLFWNRAVEAVEQGRPKRVEIECVELAPQNFENLQREISGLSHPGVTISASRGKFAEKASEAAERLARLTRVPPVFWTADPFGFRGVPLAVIRKLMALERSEVLITFMVRDMRRFLGEENFDAPLNEFFGGEAWRACLDGDADEDREQSLLLTYSALIRDGVARFATPFRVFEDDRSQTLYYLVHLTNHPLGMRQMKKAMFKESPDMTFWPVTRRPPDQLELDTAEQPPYPRLQEHLADAFANRKLDFEELLNEDYPVGLWLEPEYRAALLNMEKRGVVQIERPRTTKTGQKPRGLKLEDKLGFGGQATLI